MCRKCKSDIHRKNIKGYTQTSLLNYTHGAPNDLLIEDYAYMYAACVDKPIHILSIHDLKLNNIRIL